jgi:hypothetical protein
MHTSLLSITNQITPISTTKSMGARFWNIKTIMNVKQAHNAFPPPRPFTFFILVRLNESLNENAMEANVALMPWKQM